MVNLDTYTVNELVAEIQRRCPDGCVVAYELPEHEADDQDVDWKVHIGGDLDVLCKLMVGIRLDIEGLVADEGEDED